ncbi:MutS domain V [Caloramator fervidus]|uniref:MutS domain V n=1 Tax=Caloramator fervidus TaxID=29344 RepID=A0A1H5W302_9CLOT|nr:hypothetical protein [Caloramator fervidus]SEF93763.1 MutS domain V [Caloramator fervidus]
MKFFDIDLKEIGFEYVYDQLQPKTIFGMDKKRNLKFYKKHEKELLIREFDELEKVIEKLRYNNEIFEDIETILLKFKDIRKSISRCKNGCVLDEVELFEIKNFCLNSNALRNLILQAGLYFINLNSLEDVFKLLDPEGKNMPTFHIYSAYSKKLEEIRNKKLDIERKILYELDEKIIDILKEERLRIVIEEEEEELKIKTILSEKISFYSKKFEENFEAIGKLDFLIEKAKLAIKYDAVKPNLDDNRICFVNQINPYVLDLLRKNGKNFVPITIEIPFGTTVITGANMGGKSITLKTITLNLLMGHLGFFVFAKHASFPILDFIYFVSDDLQSVSRGLSTFGAEIIKLNEIIEAVKFGLGFVALDEVARGTNPKEGYAIVKALCKYLNKFKSFVLVSTHYDSVVDNDMSHYQVIGLRNVNFNKLKKDLALKNSIEVIQEYMDYRLVKVQSLSEVPKDALNISKLLGFNQEVINMAENILKEGEGYEK